MLSGMLFWKLCKLSKCSLANCADGSEVYTCGVCIRRVGAANGDMDQPHHIQQTWQILQREAACDSQKKCQNHSAIVTVCTDANTLQTANAVTLVIF